MNRNTLLAFTALGLLAACQPPGSASPRLASEHVPTISQTVMTHDMSYAGGGVFSNATMTELSEWLDSVDVRYGDRVSIEDPYSGGAALRAASISRQIGTRGLMVNVEGPVTSPAIAAGMTRVVIVRAKASVPECPDHGRISNPEYGASKTSNYSCANMTNMAAMIADPNDFISGKVHKGTDPDRASAAVAAMRGKMTNSTVTSSVGSAE